MNAKRPLQLLRFSLESRDLSLALALMRRLGSVADAELRRMPRLAPEAPDRPLLRTALELLAAP